jgi:6-pyruvoyltetrahydropterin/6-carboxytetrahydropterin synthase
MKHSPEVDNSTKVLRVTSSFRFEAAHFLPQHPGKCKELHGHSYKLEVTIAGEVNESGMVMDFSEIQAIVDESIIQRWDHKLLNDSIDNPTAENIALICVELLRSRNLPLSSIKLWETEDGWVEVSC